MDMCRTTIYIYLMISTSLSPSEGDALEIFPANIFGESTAKAGQNVKLKCSISHIQSSNQAVHMYLCKNGVGERLQLLDNKDEHTFTLSNISLQDSGSYSCVYSFKLYPTKTVRGSGKNSIHVQVSGDALEIFPARIFGTSTAKVGEHLILQCSISHIQSSNQAVNMYLCKNGVGERLQLLDNKDEHTFTLSNISLQDSGNYSCVYSFTRYYAKNVTGSGENSIHVQVNGDALEIFPANIFGESTAKAGQNVKLKCSISHIQSSNQAVHMYLCKNGVGERLQLLDNKDEHTFTLSNISLQDSGSYSCVYSFKLYPTKTVRGSGKNSIHVQVSGDALEIFPARIFGTSTAKVGEHLILQCSISHIQSSNQAVHMYLCKNGVGERLQLLDNKDEHTFTLSNISLQDSGRYSCVYSFTRYYIKDVRGSGENSIHVQVNGDALEIFPANIFGESTAKAGQNVKLKCSISHIQSSNQAVHMYLCKNGVGERLQLLDNKDEHTFTLSNISLQDSGSYSCVYSFKLYPTKTVRGSGKNSIHVQVSGDALEIFPARIFGTSTAKVGEHLILQCSISHIQSSNQAVHMYLCKNGVGKKLQLLDNKDEHTFILSNISLQDSGRYSCVYSFTRYYAKNVRGSGENSIHVQVNDDRDSGKDVMIYLAALLLVGVVFIQMYRYRLIIYQHYQLCRVQGQSEPVNLSNSEGLGQVNQTVNSNDLNNDLGEYATIPEVKENDPKTQRETEQSEATAIYAKVLKQKK
ncbi:immunoglobulin superfamily member 1-like isoform X2 [Tachysurus vachellii]|uniref:immunoglobulin superfamily member 1-like isoform X2 n=1 Tax=Tachysurus vachellii TaxID=175792 RepID=UPI00296AA242|nr:immunoglobulin superfamily member 1-like isoform X2 [Tachysurus vachellii]